MISPGSEADTVIGQSGGVSCAWSRVTCTSELRGHPGVTVGVGAYICYSQQVDDILQILFLVSF